MTIMDKLYIYSDCGNMSVDGPLIKNTILPRFVVGQPYTYSFKSVDGMAPFTWEILAQDVGAGTIVSDNYAEEGRFSYTPSVAQQGILSLKVSDVSGRSHIRNFMLIPQ